MFDQIFEILDIPLACVFLILTMFGMLIVKNIYSIFLSLFISIFMLIFTSSTILTQQIYLGEFLVISTFFMLIIVFFIFNLDNDFDITRFENKEKFNIKTFLILISCIATFTLVGLNFNAIVNSNTNFITRNIEEKTIPMSADKKMDSEYSDYIERISLLNQNKVFQRLTHVVMFYTCAVIVLYFFNRREDINER